MFLKQNATYSIFGALSGELILGGNMAGNLFSGTIPVEITNIQGLQILDMGPGVLTGTIPSEFGTLRALRKFV